MGKTFTSLFIILAGFSILLSQSKTYEGPDDPAGDKANERSGYMNANRVSIYFQNTSELARWSPDNPDTMGSYWPVGESGTIVYGGIAFMVGAKVYLENDSIPVTDISEIESRDDLDSLFYLQTSYREEMDQDINEKVEWGFYPVSGYFNPASTTPAMSNDPNSWPTAGWPSANGNLIWPGEWNSRFGRGVRFADLETFYVINDAQDQEYLGITDKVKYFPRPGKFIETENSTQPGLPWGGIGIRVEVRGFQWDNEDLKDVLFWEYAISNISEYDLPQVAVGYWVDHMIGSGISGGIYFDDNLDLVYCWDSDGIGEPGKGGIVAGLAFLETPGLAFDGIDNDEDGLVDESRDNERGSYIYGSVGIYGESCWHWQGDEDGDWEDGIDENNDGIYQETEFAGDDIGLDGVAPGDLNYTGPDPDGTEGNHMPDYVWGEGCEPNYNALDVNESDMKGLSSFQVFPIPSHSSSYHWFRGDESMWYLIGKEISTYYFGNISNLITTFSSGPFPLYKGTTVRISIAEMHAYESIDSLNSSTHSAPELYKLKRKVQEIYENDYQYNNQTNIDINLSKNRINNYKLEQNFPNPFNSSTTIPFTIPKKERIKIKLYDIQGREINTLLNKVLKAGEHKFNFSIEKIASGIYIYQIEGDKFKASRKLIYLK